MSDTYEAGTEQPAEELAAVEALEAQIAGGEPAEPVEREKPEPTPEYTPADDVAEKPDVEVEKARAQGWVPQDEWKGNPDDWVDAQTFNDRGDPRKIYGRLVKKDAEHKEEIARVTKMAERALEIQRAQAEEKRQADIAALKAERDALVAQAARAGNMQEVARVNDAYEQVKGEIDGRAEPEANPTPSPAMQWERVEAFQKDPVFKAAAYAICEQNKDKPAEEQLRLVDEQLASRFPEIYGEPKKAEPKVDAPPAQHREMAGVRVSGSRSSNYASRLPSGAKSFGAQLVKEGAFKNIEEYAKDYFND